MSLGWIIKISKISMNLISDIFEIFLQNLLHENRITHLPLKSITNSYVKKKHFFLKKTLKSLALCNTADKGLSVLFQAVKIYLPTNSLKLYEPEKNKDEREFPVGNRSR
jgi:hypothetical protein